MRIAGPLVTSLAALDALEGTRRPCRKVLCKRAGVAAPGTLYGSAGR